MPFGASAAVIAGVAAVGSAYIGSEASGRASDAQTQAAERAGAMSTRAADFARRDLGAYREAGLPALQQLMYLTGISPNKAGSAESKYNGPLVDSAGGVPTPVASLYSSDPAYRKAWDEYAQMHQDRFGKGYTRDSDVGGIERAVRERLPAQQSQDVAATQDAAKNDPNFGSLVKPFDYSMVDFYKDPSYNFRLQQGEQALTRAQSARGTAQGTPGLKSLMRYNQDYASNEYGAAFSRAFGVDQSNKQNQFNFLAAIANQGQNAAAGTGSISMTGANTAANAMMAGGAASAQGIMGSASSTNNAVQGGLSNYMYQQRYDQMMQRMPVFGSGNTGTAANTPNYGGYSPSDLYAG